MVYVNAFSWTLSSRQSMSTPLGTWMTLSSSHHHPSFCNIIDTNNNTNISIHVNALANHSSSSSSLSLIHQKRFPGGFQCSSRRRSIRGSDNDDEEGGGYNKEMEMMEMYTQFARDEVLLVKATLDDQEIEVIIFKGFSSCLSYKTSSNTSESVVPERALIKSIDRIKGPFDPSNIEYLEQGLAWMDFKTRIKPH